MPLPQGGECGHDRGGDVGLSIAIVGIIKSPGKEMIVLDGVVSLQYNAGFFHDIVRLTLCQKTFCPYSQCSHLNVLT